MSMTITFPIFQLNPSVFELFSNNDAFSKVMEFHTTITSSAAQGEQSEVTRFLVDEITRSKGNIRMQELAGKTHYSERHISRVFHDNLGIAPKTFARMIRLQNALFAIIENPQTPISQYLEDLGYSDQAHFQREFKEYIGITPKNFQRMLMR